MPFSIIDLAIFAIEIIIFFTFYYLLLKALQGTRGVGILVGVVLFLAASLVVTLLLSQRLELLRVKYFIEEWLLKGFLFAIIVIFQPELRRAFVKLGESSKVLKMFAKDKVTVIDLIVNASMKMSKKNIGALIAIERNIGLNSFAEGGVKLDSELTPELVETIFYPGSALHDGGVVVKEGRIVAAGCLFPLSENPNIAKYLGTRHRAGIGITEETDAISVIVSEETGNISIGTRGYLIHNVDKDSLSERLNKLYLGKNDLPEQNQTQAIKGNIIEDKSNGNNQKASS